MEEYTRKMKKYIITEEQLSTLIGKTILFISSDSGIIEVERDTIFLDEYKSPNSKLKQDNISGNLAAEWNNKPKYMPRAKSPNSKRFELEQRKTEALEALADKVKRHESILSSNITSIGRLIDRMPLSSLTEEDVRRIVNDYMFKNEESHYELHPLMIECVIRIVKEEMKRVQHIPGTTTVSSSEDWAQQFLDT